MTDCGSASGEYVLYGAPVSLYTGKARSYLRKQRAIAWVERLPSDARYQQHILPRIKRNIIPVLETPDGTIVQDTTDIIDHLEGARLATLSAYPNTPRQTAFALIMEAFAEESLLRQAMHYRWSFAAANGEFLSDQFAALYGLQSDESRALGRAGMTDGMARMARTLGPLGVTDRTIPELEDVLRKLLEALQAHFLRLPYLLGWRPTLADYGLLAPFHAHLCRDPHPGLLVKQQAPQVFRWVERMNAPDLDIPEFHGAPAGELLPDDEIPQTLEPVLDLMVRYYLPEIEAVAAATDAWLDAHEPARGAPVHPKPHIHALGEIEFSYGSVSMRCAMRPFMLYKRQRLTDFLAGLASGEREAVLHFLAAHGLEPLSTIIARRRVDRLDNLEVWGPAAVPTCDDDPEQRDLAG